MPSVLVFALSAGVAMAVYSICLRLASAGIHPVLGATVITGSAFAVNLVMLGARARRCRPRRAVSPSW